MPPTTTPSPTPRGAFASRLGAAALAATLLFGAIAAARVFWCSDDAFISFRYAKNLVDGLGLVFNAGERVEGYTNFSWTVLVAGAMRFGADPVVFAQWAGLGCFLATITLLARASRRISGPDAPFLPVAAVGFALHEHGQVFASGGLETSLFTLLATATVYLGVAAHSPRGLFGAGCLGVLATMTRPDGILLYGIAGLAALARAVQQRRVAPFLAIALPGLLFYAPYYWWRFSYYGWPFPNTFYAKSAASPYAQQGLYYVAIYFACYYVLALAPLGMLAAALPRRNAVASIARPLAIAVAGAVALYVCFVSWVGGDFMFGRFLVPITPLLYLGIELLRARWPGAGLGVPLLVAVAALTCLRIHPGEEITKIPSGRRGVVEERLNYTPEKTAAMRAAGDWLREITAGREVRVVIEGAQAIWAYYGEFAVVIEGCTGLTDEHIAHLPIGERKSVGHEKSILALDPGYLLRRRVHFSLHLDAGGYLPNHPRHIRFGPAAFGVIVTYDRELMRALRGREGVEFVDYERLLDDAIARLPQTSDQDVQALWAEAKLFYFDHNQDPDRERPFRARLQLR